MKLEPTLYFFRIGRSGKYACACVQQSTPTSAGWVLRGGELFFKHGGSHYRPQDALRFLPPTHQPTYLPITTE